MVNLNLVVIYHAYLTTLSDAAGVRWLGAVWERRRVAGQITISTPYPVSFLVNYFPFHF